LDLQKGAGKQQYVTMIQTENLRLIPCQPSYLKALATGKAELGKLLNITVAEGWPQFAEAYKPSPENPADLPEYAWGTILFILEKKSKLIGSGGFKGKPDSAGIVEFGYEIAPEHSNAGYGTEAARGMLGYAFTDPSVKKVIAHTLGEVNASNRLLQKLGFHQTTEVTDPEHGTIWQWVLNKPEFSP
jgi:[ribosomal protein S5]-alanine N-acetyltransferase